MIEGEEEREREKKERGLEQNACHTRVREKQEGAIEEERG